jgi:DNA repair protein RAD5
MASMENGDQSAREATAIHPLWQESVDQYPAVRLDLTPAHRFVFPSEPTTGVIDLTMVERSFYFNPYSGELSLEFPKAEIKCPGGILA